MNAKEFIKQQGFGYINSKQRPINIEIANVAYLMEQYAEFKMQQANGLERSSDKCHIQNVIGWLLLYTAGFMTFSMFMYVIEGSDKWFSRLALAVVSAGFSALLNRD